MLRRWRGCRPPRFPGCATTIPPSAGRPVRRCARPWRSWTTSPPSPPGPRSARGPASSASSCPRLPGRPMRTLSTWRCCGASASSATSGSTWLPCSRARMRRSSSGFCRPWAGAGRWRAWSCSTPRRRTTLWTTSARRGCSTRWSASPASWRPRPSASTTTTSWRAGRRRTISTIWATEESPTWATATLSCSRRTGSPATGSPCSSTVSRTGRRTAWSSRRTGRGHAPPSAACWSGRTAPPPPW